MSTELDERTTTIVHNTSITTEISSTSTATSSTVIQPRTSHGGRNEATTVSTRSTKPSTGSNATSDSLTTSKTPLTSMSAQPTAQVVHDNTSSTASPWKMASSDSVVDDVTWSSASSTSSPVPPIVPSSSLSSSPWTMTSSDSVVDEIWSSASSTSSPVPPTEASASLSSSPWTSTLVESRTTVTTGTEIGSTTTPHRSAVSASLRSSARPNPTRRTTGLISPQSLSTVTTNPSTRLFTGGLEVTKPSDCVDRNGATVVSIVVPIILFLIAVMILASFIFVLKRKHKRRLHRYRRSNCVTTKQGDDFRLIMTDGPQQQSVEMEEIETRASNLPYSNSRNNVKNQTENCDQQSLSDIDLHYHNVTRENSVKIVHLRLLVEHLQRLHNNWKSFCKQTVQSGMQTVDSRTNVDLERRLELVTRDVAVAVDILEYGISLQKTAQQHRITDGAIDRNHELERRLDFALEELQLKEDVTMATIRRQEIEMGNERNGESVSCTQHEHRACIARESSVQQTVEPSAIQPAVSPRTENDQGHIKEQTQENVAEVRDKLMELSETEPSTACPSLDKQTVNELRHQERIKRQYSWLVDKIIAPSVAARMYQQNAITFREHESIWRSESPSQAAGKLINIIMEQPYAVFRCFKAALKDTIQDDVYLALADIDFTAKTAHCEAIRKNYYDLYEKMDLKSSGTLELLFSLGVVDSREKDSINNENSSQGKNEILLSLLSRKSFVLFQKCVQALDATGQSHLANLVRVQQSQFNFYTINESNSL